MYWVPSLSVNSYLQSPSSTMRNFNPYTVKQPCPGIAEELGMKWVVTRLLWLARRENLRERDTWIWKQRLKMRHSAWNLGLEEVRTERAVFSNSETQEAPSRTSLLTHICLRHAYTSRGGAKAIPWRLAKGSLSSFWPKYFYILISPIFAKGEGFPSPQHHSRFILWQNGYNIICTLW